MNDFEAALQCTAAIACQAAVIVTRNTFPTAFRATTDRNQSVAPIS